MRCLTPALMAASLAAVCLAPAAASAASNRVWVSGHGVDQAGCGAPAAPCRSLQYAHDNAVAAGGEIDILDPAGYGALSITKAVSIVNDGVGVAGVQATAGAAITIAAGAADSVYLRGLNIDGVLGQASDGIRFNSGRTLIVSNCVVRHFSNDGLLVQPASGTVSLFVTGSLFGENANGVTVWPPSGSTAIILGTLDRVSAIRNASNGVLVLQPNSGTTSLAVVRSVLNDNPGWGMAIGSGGLSGVNLAATVDETHLDLNGTGLEVDARADLHLSRSTLNQNATFGVRNLAAAPGHLFSTLDNRIEGNPDGATLNALTTEPLN